MKQLKNKQPPRLSSGRQAFETALKIAILLLSAFLYFEITSFPRTEIYRYWIEIAVLFIGYFFLLKSTSFKQKSATFFIIVALLLRIATLFHLPNLTDDFYRFVWDGRLAIHGENPFQYLPADIINNPHFQGFELNQALYEKLNSPHYYTIYPPVCQAIFAFSTFCFPQSLAGNVFILKLFMLLAEALSLFFLFGLLKKWNLPLHLGIIYAFNPLVIIELCGNVHFEAWMITGILGALYFFQSTKLNTLSAFFFSIAVCAKLLPLMFLPFLWRRIGWRQTFFYGLWTGLFCMLMFLPFFHLSTFLAIFKSSALYFRSFEFNASLYYLLRAIGFWLKGYNWMGQIGFVLQIIFLLSLFFIDKKIQKANKNQAESHVWAQQICMALSIYFFCAASINPWYIVPVLAFSTFTKWRFPIIWTCFLPLSYYAFHQIPYQENLYLVAIEYGCVFLYWAYESRNLTKLY